jgi:hypothetical protein
LRTRLWQDGIDVRTTCSRPAAVRLIGGQEDMMVDTVLEPPRCHATEVA